jgi:hypothetical protein
MKDKITELLKQYEDTHTQGVYRCDYDELADELIKLFRQPVDRLELNVNETRKI